MGKKLYVVSQVNLQDMKLDIELNDGTSKSKKPQYIHLQNDRFRLALSDSEYVQMAVAIREGAKKVMKKKKMKDWDGTK